MHSKINLRTTSFCSRLLLCCVHIDSFSYGSIYKRLPVLMFKEAFSPIPPQGILPALVFLLSSRVYF